MDCEAKSSVESTLACNVEFIMRYIQLKIRLQNATGSTIKHVTSATSEAIWKPKNKTNRQDHWAFTSNWFDHDVDFSLVHENEIHSHNFQISRII